MEQLEIVAAELIAILLRPGSKYKVSVGCISAFYEEGQFVVEWEEYFNPHDNYRKSDFERLHFDNAKTASECFLDLCGRTYFRNNVRNTGYYLLGDSKYSFINQWKPQDED
jgi:hypothetical protein